MLHESINLAPIANSMMLIFLPQKTILLNTYEGFKSERPESYSSIYQNQDCHRKDIMTKVTHSSVFYDSTMFISSSSMTEIIPPDMSSSIIHNAKVPEISNQYSIDEKKIRCETSNYTECVDISYENSVSLLSPNCLNRIYFSKPTTNNQDKSILLGKFILCAYESKLSVSNVSSLEIFLISMPQFYFTIHLMLWQMPSTLVYHGIKESLYHQSRFKIGHLSVTADGCVSLKIGSQPFILDMGVPLRTPHYILAIHTIQRSCIWLGRLSKRIVLSLDLESLIHKSKNS
eukprot:gnl/TRDRNA2_/TRDRNA2_177514_c1_seq1.p1 gnl/TRDRNA2_/TRDRNA2_177514_c1~~gnl/TRDRNA2_/TRDRNA2_177514_c1_seq1.p1  ORF type:complete len:288 (-),score=-27.94 gnl/TRDRNA2_/TRDRNA2_177514_c1_seq1:577-1440(-)